MDFNVNNSTFSDKYIPAPSKPIGFDDDVRHITDGMGRVKWGMDLYCFRNGDSKAVKYPWRKFGIDRWVFETKIDQSIFNMADWEKNRYQVIEGRTIDVLGPTPPKWGMKTVLMEPETCGYMPCDGRFLHWLRVNDQLARSAPTGKFAAIAAYRQMMDDSAREDAERDAEIEKRADAIYDYAQTNAFEINNRRAYFVPSEEKRIIVCPA